MRRGEQKAIATPGVNRRWNIFITMLYPSNRLKYNFYRRRRSIEFRRHLEGVLRYSSKKGYKRIVLIMDNATLHKSRETASFLQKHSHTIKPFYLPTYSPQLNIVEGRVNRKLKHEICTNHNFESLQRLVKAARESLRRLNKRHKLRDFT